MKHHWSEENREEYQLARSQCAFESEWFSGTHKAMPNHTIEFNRATFKTHEVGGWNYDASKEEWITSGSPVYGPW